MIAACSKSAIFDGPDPRSGRANARLSVLVTASARIGRQFQCNIYSYVAHDCVIGDFVTFAPKVSCNGNVHVHDGSYIGTGAIIRNGTPSKPLVIGAGAIVCMGAVVTEDVPAGTKVGGHRAIIQSQVQPRRIRVAITSSLAAARRASS